MVRRPAVVSRVGRAAESLLVRSSRLVRFGPELTVVIVGEGEAARASLSAQTASTRRFEIAAARLDTETRRARGRWVAVIDANDSLPENYVADVLRAARRRTAVVPGAEPTASVVELMTAAVLNPGTAVPIRAVRAAKASPGSLTEPISAEAHRASALAALNREPIAAGAASDAEQRPADWLAARRWLHAAHAFASIDARGPRMAKALVAARAEALRRAGDIVSGSPEWRSLLLDEAERIGLPTKDYATLNEASTRDLVIAYGFPPFVDTSGFVAARRFAGSDHPYDVLTQDMTSRRVLDERSFDLVRRDVSRRMLVKGHISNGPWPGIEHFCRTGMAMLEARERERGPYRRYYTRSMWIAPSVLGAWYKSRHSGLQWTAELSDPFRFRPDGVHRPNPLVPSRIIEDIEAAVEQSGVGPRPNDYFFDTVEWMVYALADRIIFTNENQRDFMLDSFPDATIARRARERAVVMHHPTPARPLYLRATPRVELSPGRVSFGYFGNFYTVRGVSELLDPIARISAEEQARVDLHIFTETVEEVRADVAAHAAAASVTVHPPLGYFDYLAMTVQMDWLIVTDFRKPDSFPINPYLPSKAAEYEGSGSRVWAIVEDGSVLSTRTFDERSRAGDPEAGADALRRIMRANGT